MKLNMLYMAHFHDLVGTEAEVLEFAGQTAGDCIDLLEQKYPGTGPLLRRADGTAAPQNAFVLNRQGARAVFVNNFGTQLQDEDSITLM